MAPKTATGAEDDVRFLLAVIKQLEGTVSLPSSPFRTQTPERSRARSAQNATSAKVQRKLPKKRAPQVQTVQTLTLIHTAGLAESLGRAEPPIQGSRGEALLAHPWQVRRRQKLKRDPDAGQEGGRQGRQGLERLPRRRGHPKEGQGQGQAKEDSDQEA